MREALAEALQDFSGAMVIVSHDRHLLNVTCDKLLLVNNQSVAEFPLGLDDYPKWLNDHNSRIKEDNNQSNSKTKNTTSNLSSKERKRLEAKQRQKTAPLRKKARQLESIIEQHSIKIADLNEQLTDGEIYTDKNKEKLQKILIDKSEFEKIHDTAESDWLDIHETIEQLNKQ
jgi:ATP-binding cassette subfamily F protein 3